MRVVKVWFLLLVLVVLTVGCLSESTQIETTPTPDPTETPQPTLTPDTSSTTTSSSSTITITTIKIATTTSTTTKPLTPVAEYASEKGLRLNSQILNELETTGLSNDVKNFIDLIERTNGKYDGGLYDLYNDDPTYISKLLELDDALLAGVVDNIYGTYFSETKINYLKKALDFEVVEIAFDQGFLGEGYAAQYDIARLESYKSMTDNSQRFAQMPKELQIFIINSEISDIDYIETIPLEFDPNDKTIDTDGGGVEDYYEIKYMGDILDSSDDESIMMNNNIPGKFMIDLPFDPENFTVFRNGLRPYGLVDKNHIKGKPLISWELKLGTNIFAVRSGKISEIYAELMPETRPVRKWIVMPLSEVKEIDKDKIVSYRVYLTLDNGYVVDYQHLGKIFVQKGDYVKWKDNIGTNNRNVPLSIANPYQIDLGLFTPSRECIAKYFTEDVLRESKNMLKISPYPNKEDYPNLCN